MLARSSRLSLRSGDSLTTPLLVPSLSSKGFPVLTTKSGTESEVGKYFEVAAPALNEALLVSAYDIKHRLLPDPDAFRQGFLQSVYGYPKLLIIDSGGYEKSRDYDSGTAFRYPVKAKPWGSAKLIELIRSFGPDVTGALVNYDGRGNYEKQIRDAQEFHSRWSSFLSIFLIKPEPRVPYVRVERLIPHLRRLAQFDAVGVTEKELGFTFLQRALAIARLRKALNEASVDVPIHVFGSLDTLFTPLYFLCGAEIFDGLTWLRYAYRDGYTIYPEAAALIEKNLEMRTEQRVARMITENLAYLGRLRLEMRRYVNEGTTAVFGPSIAGVLQDILSTVEASLAGGEA